LIILDIKALIIINKPPYNDDDYNDNNNNDNNNDNDGDDTYTNKEESKNNIQNYK